MTLRLGELLIEKRIITPRELELALKEQQKTKKLLGEVLIGMGFVTERRMLQILAEQQGIPFLELKNVSIDDKAVQAVPAKFIWHYKIMPVNITDNVLTIAVSNPLDAWPVDDLEAHSGLRVEKVLAVSADIMEAARKYYGVGADTIERLLSNQAEYPRIFGL